MTLESGLTTIILADESSRSFDLAPGGSHSSGVESPEPDFIKISRGKTHPNFSAHTRDRLASLGANMFCSSQILSAVLLRQPRTPPTSATTWLWLSSTPLVAAAVAQLGHSAALACERALHLLAIKK